MKVKIEDIARRLLQPQETLDTRLYDYTDMMRREICQKILYHAQFFLDQTIGNLPGLKISDICVAGSEACFNYHQFSDIDIRIEVHNKKCPFLNKDSRKFNEFLSVQANSFYRQGNSAFIGKQPLDFKMSSYQVDLLGLYSVTQNKWRLYPSLNATRGISLENLMEAYIKRRDQIKADVALIKKTCEGVDLAEKLNEYFYTQVSSNSTVKDYLVFKLLNYAQLIRPIGEESIRVYNQALSL